MVRVMRYQYAQGERRLVPAGTAQTDDQGQYRVWGLNPGDYYVSADRRAIRLRRPAAARRRRGRPRRSGGPAARRHRRRRRGGRARRQRRGAASARRATIRISCPTRRPIIPASPRSTTRGPSPSASSQEVARHQLQPAARAHVARSAGTCTNPDGTPTRAATSTLMPDGAPARARQLRHELRQPHRVGRRVLDRQRPAGPLHAARARQRHASAPQFAHAAARPSAAAIVATSTSC